MKCPSCNNSELINSERQGFMLDQCPECKGIWFERGEIDKIISKMSEIDVEVKPTEGIVGLNESIEHKPDSAITESIYKNKELHHAHSTGSKHHWIHRLFD
jgi:Zn-finger nucleic acid-binding protein